MHTVIFNKLLPSTADHIGFDPGVEYLVESQSLPGYAAWAKHHEAEMSYEYFKEPDFFAEDVKDAKRPLIIRAGGIGDILFTQPMMNQLQLNAPLTFATIPRHYFVVRCQTTPFPIKLSEYMTYDWVLNLEGVVENGDKHRHIVNLFFDAAGMDADNVPEHAKRTDFPLCRPQQGKEFGWMSDLPKKFPKDPKIMRVAVQASASSPVRSYPHMREVIWRLHAAKGPQFEIVIYGEPQPDLPEVPERMIDLRTTGTSFQENIEFLRTCDACIGVDSSITHFAGAMDIPTVAIYGSFHWKYRTAYQPSIFALQGNSGCSFAPCFYHSHGEGIWPKGCPQKNDVCSVLAGIDPVRVVRKLEQILGI